MIYLIDLQFASLFLVKEGVCVPVFISADKTLKFVPTEWSQIIDELFRNIIILKRQDDGTLAITWALGVWQMGLKF